MGQRRQAGRDGRLIRRVIVLFSLFALVGVLLNCALGYLNTYSTYIDAESDRLGEVGAYSSSSITSAVTVDSYTAEWDQLVEHLGDYETVAQADAAYVEYYDRYTQLYTQLEQKYGSAESDDVSADEQAQLDEAYEKSQQAAGVETYVSLREMFVRACSTFQVDAISLYSVDAATKGVTYIAAVSSDEQGGGSAGVYGTGEDRSQGYDLLWQAVSSGAPSDASRTADGQDFVVYVPFTSGSLSLVVEVSEGAEEFEAAVLQRMAGTVALTCLVFALVLAAVLAILRNFLVKPVTSLSGHVRRYAATHDAQASAAIRAERFPADELGTLAADVADMMDEVGRHVQEVARVSAENERVRSELELASHIQLSALPAVTPQFAGADGRFSLFASMQPAKQVGGDFFDFFMVDADHLAVVVADVSGKGVPAALFMMRAKALIRQLLSEGLPPERAMAKANDGLAADNDESMFVTVWLGVLEISTGIITCANAGHEYPALKLANGKFSLIKDPHGLVLACFDDSKYTEYEMRLAPGDTLYVYTDGVAEATDAENNLFGTDRMLDSLNSDPEVTPRELLTRMKGDIDAFVGDAPQFDDITMLGIRYLGTEQ